MRIWFHGTNKRNAKKITDHGFKPGTHFAAHLEDAIGFGGPYVFWVALENEPMVEGNWQMVVRSAVPESAIVELSYYDPVLLLDYPDRRKSVFKKNMADATVN